MYTSTGSGWTTPTDSRILRPGTVLSGANPRDVESVIFVTTLYLTDLDVACYGVDIMATLTNQIDPSKAVMRKILKSTRNKIRRHVQPGTSFSLQTVIGCDRDQFRRHIESSFDKGKRGKKPEPAMTWENYGGDDGWWLVNSNDHKQTDFTDSESFLGYFNFLSYKPVWIKEAFHTGSGLPTLKQKTDGA